MAESRNAKCRPDITKKKQKKSDSCPNKRLIVRNIRFSAHQVLSILIAFCQVAELLQHGPEVDRIEGTTVANILSMPVGK